MLISLDNKDLRRNQTLVIWESREKTPRTSLLSQQLSFLQHVSVFRSNLLKLQQLAVTIKPFPVFSCDLCLLISSKATANQICAIISAPVPLLCMQNAERDEM